MTEAREPETPVKVKALLVDPVTLRVVWLNESAEEGLLEPSAGDVLTLDHAMPMAEPLGMRDTVRAVAETGEPVHLRTDVISTRRGSMGIAASVYRLPDGQVLVLAEHAWQNAGRSNDKPVRQSRGRR